MRGSNPGKPANHSILYKMLPEVALLQYTESDPH